MKAGISNTMTRRWKSWRCASRCRWTATKSSRQWWRGRVSRRLRGESRLAGGGPHGHGHHLLRAHQVPAFGLLGGHAGAPTSVHVVDAEGNHESRNSKGPAFPVPDGYSVAYDVAGSGGYGDPANRDPESIREDIVHGYVSAEKASEEYGVDAAGMVCPHCGGATSSAPR